MGVTAGFVGRLVDRVGRRPVILVTGAMTSLMLCAEAVGILSGAAVWLLVVAGGAPGRHDPADLGVDALAVVAARARGHARERVRLRRDPARARVRDRPADRRRPRHRPEPRRWHVPLRGLLPASPRSASPLRRRPGRGAPEEERGAHPRGRASLPRNAHARVRGRRDRGLASARSRWRCPRSPRTEGSRGAVGPLITVWALGSVIGGLWYGARIWTQLASSSAS